MLNTKFEGTPGVWRVDVNYGVVGHVAISAPTHDALALVVSRMDGDDDDAPETKMLHANAVLIAGAPDLLSAAQALLALILHPSLETDESIPELIAMQAAIKKATDLVDHTTEGDLT